MMSYELFWASTSGGGSFWVETLEPFRFTEPPFKGELTIGQDDWILRSADKPEKRAEFQVIINHLNSQLEAYRSKQLSLNIKKGKE
jgi:hypothetical protein